MEAGWAGKDDLTGKITVTISLWGGSHLQKWVIVMVVYIKIIPDSEWIAVIDDDSENLKCCKVINPTQQLKNGQLLYVQWLLPNQTHNLFEYNNLFEYIILNPLSLLWLPVI